MQRNQIRCASVRSCRREQNFIMMSQSVTSTHHQSWPPSRQAMCVIVEGRTRAVVCVRVAGAGSLSSEHVSGDSDRGLKDSISKV